MSFAAPLALLLLLPLAFVLIDRFRRRHRRRVRVGTIALWRALADRESSRLRRPRPPLELLVEALLGLILVLLAAGPRFDGSRPPELVVLVDAGSAMGTEARREALDRAIATIARDSGSEPLVRRWPETPRSGPVATDEVLWAPRLAALGAAGRELWLVADAVADHDRLPAGAGLVVVDRPIGNVGITAAAVEDEGESLRIFAAFAASPDASTAGLRLRVRDREGLSLAQAAIDFAPDLDASSVELVIPAPRGDRLVLELEGETGPAFDDRVLLERDGVAPRFLLLPFDGAAAWGAALEAAGRKAARGSEPSAGDGSIAVLAASLPPSGPAIVVAAPGLPGRIERIAAPEIAGLPLEIEAGDVLSGLPAAVGLVGSSGACFELRVGDLRVLARRGGRPVVVFDPGSGLLFVADPESASAWADAVAFPVLVARLADFLAEAAGGGGRWRAGPLSTPGESAGAAAPATAARSAAPGEAAGRLERRDLRREGALSALVLLGILAFLRFRASGRRESAGRD